MEFRQDDLSPSADGGELVDFILLVAVVALIAFAGFWSLPFWQVVAFSITICGLRALSRNRLGGSFIEGSRGAIAALLLANLAISGLLYAAGRFVDINLF